VFFESFRTEALSRGLTLSQDFESIGAELTDIEDASGQCVTQANGQRSIRIDRGYWGRVSTLKQELLIFHELGHCYLGLRHNDEKDASGNCISMMASGLGDCRSNYNNRTRENYLDKLFEL